MELAGIRMLFVFQFFNEGDRALIVIMCKSVLFSFMREGFFFYYLSLLRITCLRSFQNINQSLKVL